MCFRTISIAADRSDTTFQKQFFLSSVVLKTRAVESESEGIFRWTRSRKEFLGRVGVGKKYTDSDSDFTLKS
jgi:hypothetical protein